MGKSLQGNGFTSRIPEGWTEQSTASGLILQAADGGTLTIGDPKPTTATAPAIGEATASTLTTEGYTIKAGPSATTVAGAAAFDLAAVSADGKSAVVVIAVVHGGLLYDLSFGISADLAASTPDTSGLDQIQQFWAWSAVAASSTSVPAAVVGRQGCPSGAHWCDTFDKGVGGWATANTTDFYANFLAYEGGTYRLNQRAAGIAMISSPHSIVDVSPDYGVTVAADVGTTGIAGQNPGFGLSCWNTAISGGGDGAYAFIVTAADATLVFFAAGQNGAVFATKKLAAGVVHASPVGRVAWNHLQISCAQTGGGNAHLTLSVNGHPTLSVDYPGKSDTAGPVDPGPGYGVLASGKGTDLFYDNIAVTALPAQ
ncbi:hypothetical protein SAMN04515671_3595 [Nakamurella panacisegetis]|uniref:Uncharacterized protein n=2 Tax=Nakamurella panacisegetis TaxID=1090615 RepID=A0A1H0RIT6_9ACTN|nr:hypothetical protein SAMN04515671_3595 [Nakamurella panacisegetis]